MWLPTSVAGKLRGWGGGVGGGGGDESNAMGVAPTAVWRRPARPGRGSRIQCIRWNRFRAQPTPDTRHQGASDTRSRHLQGGGGA